MIVLLKDINLPPNITIINTDTFSFCKSLKQITIPPSVTTIKQHAFNRCSSLSQVSIPSSVKIVEEYAFECCDSLDEFKSNSYVDNYSRFPGPIFVIIALISLIILIGLSINFIIILIWWSRIHPWLAHGYKSGKIVYVALLTYWISVICIIFYIILFLLIFYICEKYKNRIFFQRKRPFFIKLKHIYNILSIVILISLVLISWISSIVASVYALKTEKVDGKSIKCLRYMIDGYNGANDWVLNQSLTKQNDLKKWHSKMISKAYGKNGNATNHYCLSVGLPVLLFTIISFLITLFFTILASTANFKC